VDTLFATDVKPRGLSITPRDYQIETTDSAFRLFDSGTPGALIRIFTGGGKTIASSMVIDRWLNRGPDYRAMVLSYEIQLCDQFANEIEDVLGIKPGMERDKQQWEGQPVLVASRQTLQPKKLADADHKAWFKANGIDDLGLLTRDLAKTIIRQMTKGEIDRGDAMAMIAEHNCHWMTNQATGIVSRVHKFDWRLNWLIVADEAHKFIYGHKSIGPIYDWFAQNDKTRWLGITATPKRADGISIGHKLFPGIAIDYPLYSPRGRCAVKQGYAVPYRQKYICVEGVDFKSLAKVRGDFDDNQLQQILGTEEQLAKLVEPMLDLCGERRTLIFNVTVQMAKDVEAYINARAKCRCQCGHDKWYPTLMIGDGAQCPKCDALIDVPQIILSGDQCRAIHESVPAAQRKEIYRDHQSGKFMFLACVGLCREGYNDPDIACVTVFRPVSKAASSLAEQMKGRASRPLRGLIEGMATAGERLAAIAGSKKPDALVLDLVGITGLADCASTVLIYSEGLPDEVRELAEDLLIEGKVENVESAITEATERIEADKERIRQERLDQDRRAKEEASRRSKAGAEVTYSTHETGTRQNADPSRPSDQQIGYIRFLGMEFDGWEPTRKQASRIIGQLKGGNPCDEIAYSNQIPDGAWKASFASSEQLWKLRTECEYRGPREITRKQASGLIERRKNPNKYYADAIPLAQSAEALTEMAKAVAALKREQKISDSQYEALVERGRAKRQQFNGQTF
jgi:superfamily II DNA or RNA helicase